ncbi:c-type cytochrome [Thiohalobacter thiocyanaticus]|uniref:Cytochrome C n=1 Tax=Thiohalobacter thiocyanaticus TaxID=585455 RepID=A0A426QEF4_9GAMM|nr:cytochrome C [Thiohalobacter thiocyanaticus]RRQ20117.1 cytochrome C [Thiohalobacter thiocyanaticus]
MLTRITKAVLCAGALTLAQPAAQAEEFTEADLKSWEEQFMTVVKRGEKLFHGGLESKNTVSCDQCHPNATNTHPETYPKFQQQLGKVAVLSEMINWCIENPLETEPLALDDPRMTALQAYITWERRGVELAPGKH